MIINNNLRNEVYLNNLRHGFWDNRRTFTELCDNIKGELDEIEEQLDLYDDPKHVYYKSEKSEKPEGAPTELADVIIFVLDYFGDGYIPPDIDSSDKPDDYPIPIDINESLLELPQEYSNEWKNRMYQLYKDAKTYFSQVIKPGIIDSLSLANFYSIDELRKTNILELSNEESNVSFWLHKVIKQILEFCYLYNINIDYELRRKIDYNNSRPIGYRKIGTDSFFDTDIDHIDSELSNHPGAYKHAQEIAVHRRNVNFQVEFRRHLRDAVSEKEYHRGGR